MDPVTLTLGIGTILGNLFGNLFGSSRQSRAIDAQTQAANRAAELEYRAITDALNFERERDARDYQDWLAREARDRRDWEISETRRAPFRALSDSAVRTLADYIRVPGMHPAQEVAPQIWTHQPNPRPSPVSASTGPTGPTGPPRSTTMPIGGPRTFLDFVGSSTQSGTRQPTSFFTSPPRYQSARTLRDLTYA